MFYPEFYLPAEEDWAAIMAQYGCLLLRQAIPPEPLNLILTRAMPIFERVDALTAAGQLSEEERQLLHFGHVHIKALNLPPTLVPALLKQTGLKPVLKAILGKEFAIITQNTAPRRQEPFVPERAIPYHQDIEFLGPLGTAYNCWIPLTPAGKTAPTVELIMAAQTEVYYGLPCDLDMRFPVGQQRQDFSELYTRFPRSLFWQPQLQPGDVLVFHYLTLHRTYIEPLMFQPRFDFEIRLTTLEARQKAISEMEVIHLDR